MNQATITGIVGAITAALLTITQIMTHDKVEGISKSTMSNDELHATFTPTSDLERAFNAKFDELNAKYEAVIAIHPIGIGHTHQSQTEETK